MEYPADLKRSARVTSSRGNPHGMAGRSSSFCIPVRNVSRPVISDDFEEEDEHEKRAGGLATRNLMGSMENKIRCTPHYYFRDPDMGRY